VSDGWAAAEWITDAGAVPTVNGGATVQEVLTSRRLAVDLCRFQLMLVFCIWAMGLYWSWAEIYIVCCGPPGIPCSYASKETLNVVFAIQRETIHVKFTSIS
jgi:hypothetical protein